MLCTISSDPKPGALLYVRRVGLQQLESWSQSRSLLILKNAKTVPATTAQKQNRDDFGVFFAVFPFASSRFVVGVAVALSFTVVNKNRVQVLSVICFTFVKILYSTAEN